MSPTSCPQGPSSECLGRGPPAEVRRQEMRQAVAAAAIRRLRRRLAEAQSRLATAEAQLRHAQKMEVMGRLVGGVAHDFNNQLTVVRGYCDMLLKDVRPTDRMRKSLEMICGAVNRSAALTQRLLAFTRHQESRPEAVNPNLVVRGLAAPLGRMLGEDVRLVTLVAPDVGDIFVDQALLEHALMNLAVNARDAMPQGGTLTIETRNVDLAATPPGARGRQLAGQTVCISVSDTGVGMDERTCARAFEPFFTTKAPGHGTGLGLAMVGDFVERSGGAVTLRSEPGRGTTFELYFPRVAVQSRRQAPASPQFPKGTGTVLVVEDDADVRAVVVRVLAGCGYKVIAACGAKEAVALSLAHPAAIDLLITDVILPDGTGPELADRLRASQPKLKIIYTSGYTENVLAGRGVAGLEASLLRKPYTPDALAAAAYRAIASARLQSPSREPTHVSAAGSAAADTHKGDRP